MIDLHIHLLPGIDDGPADLEATLAMARAAVADGTRTVVATPHVNWRYRNGAAAVRAALRPVTRALAQAHIDLEVLAGGEIDASYSAQLPAEELEGLTLGGGGAILLECPLSMSAPPLDAAVLRMHRMGCRVLLAHPERSPTVRTQPGRLEAMVAGGALTQITTGSLLGQFGREVREFAFWMLEAGLVHNVASDAHDAARRPPPLRTALERAAAAGGRPGLAALAGWLTDDAPRAIVAGALLPPAPRVDVSRRGPLQRLARRLSGSSA